MPGRLRSAFMTPFDSARGPVCVRKGLKLVSLTGLSALAHSIRTDETAAKQENRRWFWNGACRRCGL